MSASLVLTYRSPVPDVTDSWLRIVREDHSLAVDAAATAELVDAIYQLDGCSDDQAELTDDLADSAGIVGPLAEELYDTEICTLEQDRTATVRIYRSHPDEEYALRTFGAEPSEVEIVFEQVSASHAIDNGSYLLLDKPVVSGFSCSWLGRVSTSAGFITPPPVTRIGYLLYWTAAVSGILQVRYRSVYDKVVLDFPAGDDPPDAELIAFYRGTATRETVSADAVEQLDYGSTAVACAGSSGSTELTPHDMTCYEEIDHYRTCACSGTRSFSYTSERGVACPEWYDPSNTSDKRLLVGRRDVNSYHPCGETDDCNSLEYYQQTCCESPPDNVSLPACCEVTTNFAGTGVPIKTEQKLRQRYPYPSYTLAIIPVGPPAGEPCGADITTQRKGTSNCCDGVVELEWDDDTSAEVIGDWSAVMVAVIGGRGPYTWKVSGSGFYLNKDRNKREIVTAGPSAVIYTAESCGQCTITVTDGCSTTKGVVLSVNGSWSVYDPTRYSVDCIGLSSLWQSGDVYVGQYRYFLRAVVDCHFCRAWEPTALDLWPVRLHVGDYPWVTSCSAWANSCAPCLEDCSVCVEERKIYKWVC